MYIVWTGGLGSPNLMLIVQHNVHHFQPCMQVLLTYHPAFRPLALQQKVFTAMHSLVGWIDQNTGNQYT